MVRHPGLLEKILHNPSIIDSGLLKFAHDEPYSSVQVLPGGRPVGPRHAVCQCQVTGLDTAVLYWPGLDCGHIVCCAVLGWTGLRQSH